MKINRILKERRRNYELKNKNTSKKNEKKFRNYSFKIGYARVSTDVQRMDLQMDALKQAGCDHIFTDHGISGALVERPGLQQAMKMLQKGDTLIVWRLDRLGRSLVHLVEQVSGLGKQGIEFRSLTENIDTSSSGGKLMFHMIAALAEFERSLISERTKAGMAAAKLRGKHVGRPKRIKLTQAALAAFWQAVDLNQDWWKSKGRIPVINCCILSALTLRDILHGMGRRDATLLKSGLHIEITAGSLPYAVTIGSPLAAELPGQWNSHMVVKLGDLIIDPTIGQARRGWNNLPLSAVFRDDISAGRRVRLTENHSAPLTTQHIYKDDNRKIQVSYFKLPRRVEQMTCNWQSAPDASHDRRAPFVNTALDILNSPVPIAA